MLNYFLKSPSTVDLTLDFVFHHSEEEKDKGESQFAVANLWKSLSGYDFLIQLCRSIL